MAPWPTAVTVTITTLSGAAESGTSSHRRPQADSFSPRRALQSGQKAPGRDRYSQGWSQAEDSWWSQAGLRTEGQEVGTWDEPLSPGPYRTDLVEPEPKQRWMQGISPGEVGGEREARVDRCPKIKILGAREAGNMQAERDLATRSQGTWGAAELQGRAG